MFPGYPIKMDPRLNEKEFGPAHLRSREELREHFPLHVQLYEEVGKYFAVKGPGGENYVDLFIRLHGILDTLRRDWAGKRVAIVCHRAVMLSARQLFEHYDPENLLRIGKEQWIENCGILHYHWPNSLWGWRNDKFRLELARPPYKLWSINEDQKQCFWKQAMVELGELQKESWKEK